ncbi:MAG: AAA family ATPase [Acidimicrobiia bacterium]|nr:AAA family ATPase [Acidimicrobiia bacterium]
MRFIVRDGTDPIAIADSTMLAAMGMPGGGVLAVGDSHIRVKAGRVGESSALSVGELARSNAGITLGSTVDGTRAILTSAQEVWLSEPVSGDLVRSLASHPVTTGDRLAIDGKLVTVENVSPQNAGIISAGTRFQAGDTQLTPARVPTVTTDPSKPAAPTTAEALLAGLDTERDLLTGWLSLLTGHGDLPTAWGLPSVAGVVLEGPHGCGKSELVAAAAHDAGCSVKAIDLNLIFKPARLLDLLESAVKTAPASTVIYVDRFEAVAGEEGLTPFKTQVAAIMRWFLDAVAERPTIACVVGITSHTSVEALQSPLLPRTLQVPPPDARRRTLLFEAALAKVPTDEIDYPQLAGRSAGFSGADILGAVLQASTEVARLGEPLTTERVAAAIDATTPSLGSVGSGEVPSYGFERVAGLKDVKQRLTEAVIWPMTQPERFRKLGIEPPRGILLYGPPGTGKTFVVRALAHEAGAAFFPIKGAELLDKFVGESERGVREVFARARAAAPSLMFFDEIDALAPVRGTSSSSVTDSVVAALLTELDGFGGRGDVVVIGATNRKDLIDPALLRSGRFEVHIELGLPEIEARRALLNIVDVPFSKDVDLDQIAADTDGLSFADMTGMLREAALNTLRSDDHALTVGPEHIEQALKRFLNR